MTSKYLLLILPILNGATIIAQHPFRHWTEAIDVRYESKQPVINYVLSVGTGDTSSYAVEMRIKNIPDTFHVAMMAHPEYDDRYWRFVENFSLESPAGAGNIVRQDSALWRIITHGGEAILHYRIHLPATEGAFRSSWKAFLTSTGGLVGGPHSFMYIVGATTTPSYVTVNIPASWQAVTGLQSTFRQNTFFASSAYILMDDPIFIGKFKAWTFEVLGVPHRITYWPLPASTSFDSTKLISAIRKIVEQASAIFGRLPYKEYSFMLQDGAHGSLEHNNSVTVGAPSSQLGSDMTSTIAEIAHEFFHTWNLVRIRPVEYGDIDYKTPPLSKGLWFSEGLTMFYADQLIRRANLHSFDSTRINHVETLIRRFLLSPAYLKYSAEMVSLASYGPVGMLGDYSASTHLQGEVLGTILDLIIRNASDGRSSIDDVMRTMMECFSSEKGFTTADVENAVQEVCHCDVSKFFLDHVYGTRQIDFNKYLALLGLRMTLEWKPVVSNDKTPMADLRVYSWQAPNEHAVRLGITNPSSCWGKAGLHTGDILRAVNRMAVTSTIDFRQAIRNVRPGDTVVVEVQRLSGHSIVNVFVTGYDQPEVHIVELDRTSAKQKMLLNEWNNNL